MLEWLQPSVTAGMSFNTVQGLLATTYAGFSFGTTAEHAALFAQNPGSLFNPTVATNVAAYYDAETVLPGFAFNDFYQYDIATNVLTDPFNAFPKSFDNPNVGASLRRSTVPEPSGVALGLLVCGLAWLLVIRRRVRSADSVPGS